MASLTIGRYVPYNSFIHKMDPRAKLFALIVLMVAIFLPYPTYVMSFTIQGIIFLFGVFLLWRSHVSFFRVLKSLAALWIMVIFILIIYVLVPRTTNYPAFDINGFVIYWDSILEAARILLRLVLMIVLSMVLTSSTKPLDLTGIPIAYRRHDHLIGSPFHPNHPR